MKNVNEEEIIKIAPNERILLELPDGETQIEVLSENMKEIGQDVTFTVNLNGYNEMTKTKRTNYIRKQKKKNTITTISAYKPLFKSVDRHCLTFKIIEIDEL